MKKPTIKIIKGDLILKENTVFDISINVEGNIKGYFDLKVKGNIDARNINAWNIDALNIDALNINALNINARNIDARNINAWNINALNIDALNIDARNIDARNIIFCDKIRVKEKVICKVLIKDRFNLERKEWNI